MLKKDRNLLNNDGSIPVELIKKCIEEHKEIVENKLQRLDNYYAGQHDILNRSFSSSTLPNNKIVCNHAEYITDMAVAYVFGNPITYAGEGSEELNEIFTEIDEDSHNNELALDISIFGVGNELVYMNDDDVPYPELAALSPLNSFVVTDDTVKHKPMFGVSYSEIRDIDNNLKGYKVNVYTEDKILQYSTDSNNLKGANLTLEAEEEHYFDGIPLIEYKNNKNKSGDFEKVITLIDAYNILQSDRVNDKEQLVDALLAVSGMTFGDDEEEKVETAKLLKELKILELEEGGDAKYLTKQLNETEIEVLKKSLKDDIHEFSKVPCLTDENFASNASGIAMKYKLLAFEQLGKTKERYFKKGLRKRLKLIANIKEKQRIIFDPKDIDIKMTRSLPVDEELRVKILADTEGLLSTETRLQKYDGEMDVQEEIKKLEAEKQANIEREQKAFGSYDFKTTEGVEDEE